MVNGDANEPSRWMPSRWVRDLLEEKPMEIQDAPVIDEPSFNTYVKPERGVVLTPENVMSVAMWLNARARGPRVWNIYFDSDKGGAPLLMRGQDIRAQMGDLVNEDGVVMRGEWIPLEEWSGRTL